MQFLRKFTKGIECFSVTNGPRQVEPLSKIGHQHVIVEIDLYPMLGVRDIVESEFGVNAEPLNETDPHHWRSIRERKDEHNSCTDRASLKKQPGTDFQGRNGLYRSLGHLSAASGQMLPEPRHLHALSKPDKEIFFISGVVTLISHWSRVSAALMKGLKPMADLSSTASVAKILDIPVVLVVSAQSITRSAAALVKGFQVFDKDVRIAAVILNNVKSGSHRARRWVQPSNIIVMYQLSGQYPVWRRCILPCGSNPRLVPDPGKGPGIVILLHVLKPSQK